LNVYEFIHIIINFSIVSVIHFSYRRPTVYFHAITFLRVKDLAFETCLHHYFIDDLNSSGPPIVSSYVHCSSLNFSTLDRVQSGGSKPDHVRSDQMASDGPSGEPGNCCRCRLSGRPTSNGSFPPQVHFP